MDEKDQRIRELKEDFILFRNLSMLQSTLILIYILIKILL